MCRDQQPQQQQEQPVSVEEDFDDISLFVSGSSSSSLRSFSLNTTNSSLTLSGLQGDQESSEGTEDTLENDTQQVCFSFRDVWHYLKKINLSICRKCRKHYNELKTMPPL